MLITVVILVLFFWVGFVPPSLDKRVGTGGKRNLTTRLGEVISSQTQQQSSNIVYNIVQ